MPPLHLDWRVVPKASNVQLLLDFAGDIYILSVLGFVVYKTLNNRPLCTENKKKCCLTH